MSHGPPAGPLDRVTADIVTISPPKIDNGNIDRQGSPGAHLSKKWANKQVNNTPLLLASVHQLVSITVHSDWEMCARKNKMELFCQCCAPPHVDPTLVEKTWQGGGGETGHASPRRKTSVELETCCATAGWDSGHKEVSGHL